jgi:hypothetical protein
MPTTIKDKSNQQKEESRNENETDHLELSHTSMTYQYYRTLRVLFEKAKSNRSDENEELFNKVGSILYGDEKSWALAQEAECLLVELLDEETMRLELCRRMSEIENIDSELIQNYYKTHSCQEINKMEPDAEDEARQKHVYGKEYISRFFSRLVLDLQWQSNKEYKVQNDYADYVENTAYYFKRTVFIFFAFLVLSLTLSKDLLPIAVPMDFSGNEWIPSVSTTAVLFVETILHWILIAVAGAMGAAFSIISSKINLRQETIKSMRLKKDKSNIKSRILYGAGAALILFLLLQAKFIEGAIFELITPAEERQVLDVARIGVLGVLAGFSEQMVSKLLSSASKKAKIK